MLLAIIITFILYAVHSPIKRELLESNEYIFDDIYRNMRYVANNLISWKQSNDQNYLVIINTSFQSIQIGSEQSNYLLYCEGNCNISHSNFISCGALKSLIYCEGHFFNLLETKFTDSQRSNVNSNNEQTTVHCLANFGQINFCEFINCGTGGDNHVLHIKCSTFYFIHSIINFTSNSIDSTTACAGIKLEPGDNYITQCNFSRTYTSTDTSSITYTPEESSEATKILSIIDNTFDHCYGTNARCFRIYCNHNVIFSDNIICNNDGLNNGINGMISLYNQQEIVIDSCVFRNNHITRTQCGGNGLWLNSGGEGQELINIIYQNCIFEDNSNPEEGGGLQQASYRDNKPSLRNCNLYVLGCEFRNNYARQQGGAIAISTFRPVYIDNCQFYDNHADQWNAGAIYIYPVEPGDDFNEKTSITNCYFSGNYAPDSNCIYIGDSSAYIDRMKVIIQNNTFIDNYAPSGNNQRVIFSNQKHSEGFIVSNCTFEFSNSNPTSATSCRALEFSSNVHNIEISKTHFINIYSSIGAAISIAYCSDISATIKSCSFTNLITEWQGSAILLNDMDHSIDIIDCGFTDCYCNVNGRNSYTISTNTNFINLHHVHFNHTSNSKASYPLYYTTITSTLTLEDLIFENVTSSLPIFEFPTITYCASIVNFVNCSIIDCYVPDYIISTASTINSFKFESSIVNYTSNLDTELSALIYSSSNTVNILYSQFINTNSNGTIKCSDVQNKLTIDNCIFDNCKGLKSVCFDLEIESEKIEFQNNVIQNITSAGFSFGRFELAGNDIELVLLNITFFGNSGSNDPFTIVNSPLEFSNNVVIISFTECKWRFNQYPNSDGGAIRIPTSYIRNILFTSCIFENNIGRNGGACSFSCTTTNDDRQSNSTTLAFDSCIFSANLGHENGGAVSIDSGACASGSGGQPNAHFIHCTFAFNYAGTIGGSLAFNMGKLITIIGCTFSQNTAGQGIHSNANAIYLSTRSFATISDTHFVNNGLNGSVIYFNGLGLEMENATIQFDSSENSSRGIYIAIKKPISLYQVNFINCSAGEEGGALYYNNGGTEELDFTLTKCTFDNNTADNGCSLYIRSDQVPVIEECTFQNHENVTTGQFVLYLEFTKHQMFCELTECIFRANSYQAVEGQEDGGGSGIWIANNESVQSGGLLQLYFTDCQFIDNKSPSYGGAFAFGRSEKAYRSELYFDYCLFHNNHAEKSGGALWIKSSYLIEFCDFKQNTANEYGGSVIIDSPASQLFISRCNFESNFTPIKGGAIFIDCALFIEISHCNFSNHTICINGAAIYVSSKTKDIFIGGNNEFKNNIASNYGNAIFIENRTADPIRIVDSVFTDCGNYSDNNGMVIYSLSPLFFSNSTIQFTTNFIYARGLHIGARVNFSIINTFIKNCRSNTAGSGVYCDFSSTDDTIYSFQLIDTIFENNVARNGCALYCSVTQIPEIRGVVIRNHWHGSYTFCVFVDSNSLVNATITLDNCTFDSNVFSTRYDSGGAGLWIATYSSIVLETSLIFKNCQFTNNTSIGPGGAISYSISHTFRHVQLTFNNCAFANNSCQAYGGALAINTDKLTTISDCVFVSNAANQGNSLYFGPLSSVKIINTTFLDDDINGSSIIFKGRKIEVIESDLDFNEDEEE